MLFVTYYGVDNIISIHWSEKGLFLLNIKLSLSVLFAYCMKRFHIYIKGIK